MCVEERKRRRIMVSLVATTSTPARKPFVRTHYVRTKRRIMPSLVATTSTPARKPFVRTHYVRTKIQNRRKTPSGSKVSGRKKERKRRRIMPSFVNCSETIISEQCFFSILLFLFSANVSIKRKFKLTAKISAYIKYENHISCHIKCIM